MVIGKDSKIGVTYIPHLQGMVHIVPKSFSLERLAHCNTK